MTREEAINRIKDHMKVHHIGEYPHIRLKEALDMSITALRSVSREQVEKVWRGEWIFHPDDLFPAEAMFECKECHEFFALRGPGGEKFCPECGRAMTDEAVQMVMERTEALYGQEEAD